MKIRKKILLLGDINSVHLQRWIRIMYDDFDLAVFSLSQESIDSSRIRKKFYPEIQVLSAGSKRSDSSFKAPYLFALPRLRSFYKSFRPDIVHAHYASSYGYLAALLKHKRFYISCWGSDVYEFPLRSGLHKRILKFSLRKTQMVFSTSKAMKQVVQKYYNGDIQVIPFGVDLKNFYPREKAEKNETFRFGSIKSLRKIYGLDLFIKAFALFNHNHPESECIIYGDGPEEENLKALCKSLNLEQHLLFKGAIPHAKIPDALNSFDVFCAFSHQESFGVAIIEASACELPVIVSAADGFKEVVRDGKTGIIVEKQDPEKIALAMEKLYSSPELRKEMGLNGRAYIEKEYDWRKNSDLLKSIYHA